MALRLFHIPQVSGSTQEVAKELPLQGNPDDVRVVYTFFQQTGRGQAGNVWFGGKEKNIAATFVLEPFFLPAEYLFLMNMALSLGILDYARQRHAACFLKWPNDIYWQERKIGGILWESRIGETHLQCLYFGVGVNINQDFFPSTIPNPVSFRQIDRICRDLQAEMREMADSVYRNYTELRTEWGYGKPAETLARWKDAYLSALLYGGQWRLFVWQGRELEACIRDVDEYGRLVLETRSGRRIVADIKEVRYRFDE